MSIVRDLLAFAGFGILIWGLYQWSMPLACVVGGLWLVGCAFIWTVTARKDAQ